MMKFAIHIDELISLLDKNGISYTKGKNINSTSSEESNNNNTIGSLDSLVSGKKILNNDTASILLNSVNDQDITLLYVFYLLELVECCLSLFFIQAKKINLLKFL